MKEGGFGFSRIALGLFVFAVLASGTVAFLAGAGDPRSQVAVGAAADAMCVGGADAKCPCGKGLKNGTCDPNTSGGGKIGCPCYDMTAGQKAASGQCAQVGKCLAKEAGGMPPMLPMLPMPMPKPPSSPQQETCPPDDASSLGGLPRQVPCTKENPISGVKELLTAGDTATPLRKSATGTILTATSSDELRSRVVWFLESVGLFDATTSDSQAEEDGYVWTPFKIILERDDAGRLHLEVGTLTAMRADEIHLSSGMGSSSFKGTTFTYSETPAPRMTAFSRVFSTVEYIVDRITTWIQTWW